MPKNLGELDRIMDMRNALENITDYYNAVKNIMPNQVMESLAQYNQELEILEKNLKKQLKDIKPSK